MYAFYYTINYTIKNEKYFNTKKLLNSHTSAYAF